MPVGDNKFTIEERVKIALEDRDFNGASNSIERFLDENPTCSRAYLYKILLEYRFSSIEELKSHGAPLDENANYKRALSFATEEERIELEKINRAIKNRIEEAKVKKIYNDAMIDLKSHRYAWALDKFKSIEDFEDVPARIEELNKAWENRKNFVRYKNAITIAGEARNNKKGISKLEKAIELLSVNIEYENSRTLIASFKNRIEKIAKTKKRNKKITAITLLSISFVTVLTLFIVFNAIPNSRYNKAIECLDKGKYSCAIKQFEDLDDFKDSEDMVIFSRKMQDLDSYPQQSALVKEAKNAALESGFKVKATYVAPEVYEGVREKKISTKYVDMYTEKISLNGYKFNGWVLDSYNLDVEKKSLVFNFKAVFEVINYSISYDTVYPGAQVVGTYVYSYTVNDTVTLPTLYYEGYTFVGWKKGAGLGTLHVNSFGPGDYNENLKLVADFQANTYFASVKTTNGYVMFGETRYYKTGEEAKIWVTPYSNYELSQLYYQRTDDTNAPKVNIDGDTFIMPGYDVTVYGIFVEKQYSVDVHIDSIHSLNLNPKYKGNTDIEINVELRPGYHLTALYYTVGDSSIKHTITNGEIIKMPYSDINIYVEAIPYTYSIYKNVNSHGVVNVKSLADVDSEVEVSYTTNEGCYLEELYYILDGTSQKVVIENNKFIMPAGNVTIYAVFKEYLTINLSVDGTMFEYDVKEGTKLKEAFNEEHDLNHTMGYYTDTLCREWSNPELDVTDGMILYTKVATLDRLKFSEDNTQVYTTSYNYQVELVIPAYHNDVKVLKYNGFEERKYYASFKGIYLPYGITEIGDYAFNYTYLGTEIAELYIPSTVKVVGNEAFRGYGDAENDKLIFGGVVESVGDKAFNGLNSELTFDFEHVKYIGEWAFYDSKISGELVLSSAVEIGAFAFAKTGFTSVVISKNPQTGGAVFEYCEELVTFSAPELTNIDGGMFFLGCTSLENVYLPKLTELNHNMFNRCTSLETFEISDSVSAINAGVFYLSGIKYIVIPTSVTIVVVSAFDGCENLTYILLHENIKHINKYAEYTNMVTTIFFEGDDLKLSTIDVTEGIDVKTYSEEPIYDGNHWHYVEGIPTIYTQD